MAYDEYCINCWSTPRCCSTSLMYSFAQRSDTQVLDEPLYANFLKLTGMPRPYRDQVLAAQENDGNKVLQQQILGPRTKKVLYAKHIAKHKTGIDHCIWSQGRHMILVREPYGVVQSFSKVLQPTLQEIGYAALLEIYSELRAIGRPPIVVLSDELVRRPEAMLRSLCAALDLPFDPSMLAWPRGPKPYDGVWAPWWYANTHRSTGFDVSLRDSKEPLPEALKPLLGECTPAYELLRRHALVPWDGSVPRPLQVEGGSLDPLEGLHHQGGVLVFSPRAPPTAPTASAAAALSGLSAGADAAPAAAEPSASATGGGAAAAAAGEAAALAPKSGTHAYIPDARNADILIGMRDGVTGEFELLWRPQAKVSVFDSGFMLGDGVWEGIRVHRGVLMFIDAHLERLWEGAAALDMDLGTTPTRLQQLLYSTLDANGMGQATGVHVRLMVSRGLKPTPYQNPAITLGKPTIVIAPEWKEASPVPKEQGITLHTCHIVRGAPTVQDPTWNSHSKLNCIAACIQANKVGADEALMLDPLGFVATCNSVNFFIVRKGEVWTSTPRYCLNGVTRANVLRLCADSGIPSRETDFSLTKVYSADEAFVTGTFAGIVPVRAVDGRTVGSGRRGPVTAALQQLYMALMEREAVRGRMGEAAKRAQDEDDY